jgi:hypothetical protein
LELLVTSQAPFGLPKLVLVIVSLSFRSLQLVCSSVSNGVERMRVQVIEANSQDAGGVARQAYAG